MWFIYKRLIDKASDGLRWPVLPGNWLSYAGCFVYTYGESVYKISNMYAASGIVIREKIEINDTFSCILYILLYIIITIILWAHFCYVCTYVVLFSLSSSSFLFSFCPNIAHFTVLYNNAVSYFQIAKLMGPTWGPSGSCRPQMGPRLVGLHVVDDVAFYTCTVIFHWRSRYFFSIYTLCFLCHFWVSYCVHKTPTQDSGCVCNNEVNCQNAGNENMQPVDFNSVRYIFRSV